MSEIDYGFDVDDYVKESCDCGHRRYSHIPDGPCTRTVMRRDLTGLPEPSYREDPDGLDPFGWPANWPDLAEIPEVEKPCGCRQFVDEGTAAAESGGY